METRIERRKRMKIQRRRNAARGGAACLAAGMLFFSGTSLMSTGDDSGLADIGPPETLVAVSSESEPEAIRLSVATTPEQMPEETLWSEEEVVAVAKTVYGEAMVTSSDEEMSAVVWCILNRVDSPVYPDSIIEVVTQHSQFHGYHEENPVDAGVEALVRDVLSRWSEEKQGASDVGRTLPAEYLFFWGDGLHNHFTNEFRGGDEWDWSLPNPYDT